MADVQLLVEGWSLPAHKAVLACNSQVLAELLICACDQATGTSELKSEVPLPGESLSDVNLFLTYLYSNFTYKSEMKPIQSISDAKTLARFAHKYDMRQMLDACDRYLISKVSGNVDMITRQQLVSISVLAEQCGLRTLLAHCECLLVQTDDVNLWQCEAVISGQISQGSLLRMLRALQQCVRTQRTQMQFSYCEEKVLSESRRPNGFPTVPDMLKWQGTDNGTENQD